MKSGQVPLTDRNGVLLNTVLPPGFDAARTYPWVVFNHGADQLGSAILAGDPATQSLANALSNAGYVVVSSNYRQENCWGNQSCVDDLRNLVDAYSANLNLEAKPFLLGASMGGMVTWNAILHGGIHPRAVAVLYPACNLVDMYNTGYFNTALQNAYSFTAAVDFGSATKGYDPTGSESVNALAGIPIVMWASYGDTTVDKSNNADLLARLIQAKGGTPTVITTTGNHGDISNYQPDTLVHFFNKVRSLP